MQTMQASVHLMGTIISLQITHETPAPLLKTCIAKLKDYEQRFSANDDASELMQLNEGAGVRKMVMDPAVYALIRLGKFYSRFPDGNLNIAIGPLVKAWHIGFYDAHVPSLKTIQTALAKTDPAKIQLNDATHEVFLTEKGMEIDLGALAKGYIGDLICAYLRQQGVKSALVNLGGNVITIGTKPNGQPWRIGIQDPKQPLGNYQTVAAIQNRSVVTSGIYQRKLVTKSGTVYHHILDRHTGFPIQTDVASLTIFSQKSVDGEIWTTLLFGKPIETILKTVAALDHIDAIIITTEGQLYDTRVSAD